MILRFLRVRLGDTAGEGMDAIGSRYHKNIVIDHCSASWSVDECVSVYRAEDVTVQWCLIAESLIYNWGYNSNYGGEGDVRINLVNNVYKPGPATRESVRTRLANPYGSDEGPGGRERWWIAGNLVVGAPRVTADNWLGVHPDDGLSLDGLRAGGPFEIAPIHTDRAEVAYRRVLEHVGAFLPRRDVHDERILAEVESGTATYGGAYGDGLGIIDSQETVGGWPELDAGQPPPDSDRDGMPDGWELRYGLDPGDAADGAGDADDDGYTNLEEFLNMTDPTVYVDYTNPANNRFSWDVESPDATR